jgi:cold shock CspA family protein
VQQPLRITSRTFPLSAVYEAEIRDKAGRLDRYYDRITGCDVTIEAEAIHHHRKGGPFTVRVDLSLPGGRLSVNRQAQDDLTVAIREAFGAARRRLEDFAREQRREVKTHEPAPRARVSKLLPDEGYGFLEGEDGREIYFHRNSVLGDHFAALRVGTEVRFVEEAGVEGPQASTVIVTNKHLKNGRL